MNRSTCAGVLVAGLSAVALAAQSAPKTTWDGVYSTPQADQGSTLYADKCAKCHGPDGTGGDAPDLVGSAFASDWDPNPITGLFDRTRVDMPADAPGSLSRDQTAQIVAHLLALNGFPSGPADLPSAAAGLDQIKYVATRPAPQAPPVARAINVPGVLDGPDPAQMETAPDLGFKAVEDGLKMPAGITMGAPSSVAFDAHGHMLVFNRGQHPLMEFDGQGVFVRSFGEGRYVRPHGMRLDADGNIWTTDVNGHTVTKMSPAGDVLLTLGTRGQSGSWDEAAGTRLLFEPADIAFAPGGDFFVVEGHGRGEGRVIKFDKTGAFLKSWGGNGKGEGQFDQPHALLVRDGVLYVADRENRRVQIFDLDGKFIKSWKFAGLPCGLLSGLDGQLYLATGFSGQILRLDTNGKAVAAMGQPGRGFGEFGEAHYMAIAPSGDIYVADTINAVLHRYAKK